MASSPETAASSQEALLKLEKSTEETDKQLDAAAQILKLDLSVPAVKLFDLDTCEPVTRPAPKEEWVLRWLLKRLKIGSYRTNPRCYILLQHLLQRISRRAIASTFLEYKFSQTLTDIAEDLHNVVFLALRNGTNRGSSHSETSETIQGSPLRSKKRKRGQEHVDADDDIVMDDAANNEVHARRALVAYTHFSYSFYILMNLVNSRDERGDVSHFHLHQSLRMDPAMLAQTFGKLMRTSAGLAVEYAKEKRDDDLLTVFKTSTSYVTLWEMRRSGVNGIDEKSINAAFLQSCSLETLRFYRIIISSGVESNEKHRISQSIEKLIALHVVLPARSAFFERGGSGIDYSKDEDPDWSAVQPVTATFRPLFADQSTIHVDCSGIRNGQVNDHSCIFPATWNSAELITTFYDIVARSVPRNTFRRQNTEASWLETVFVALAELAFSSSHQLGGAGGFITLLEELLIVARVRKIGLSLHTFLTHASYTGLLKGKEDPGSVRWSLTALLIDLGVDIFLPNSGFKDSTRLLEALLQSLHHIQRDMVNQETYDLVKSKIVIPLIRAFGNARDVPSFTKLWCEQLRSVEAARSKSVHTLTSPTYSIWEDDDILLAYHDTLKSTLSDTFLRSQIETSISAVLTDSGHISNSSDSYANFIVLEASSRFWGQHGLPGLRIDLVSSLVEAIHKTLSNRKGDRHWLWRLWRVARELMALTLKNTTNTPAELAEKFKREALVVVNFSTGPTKLRSGWNGHRESFEACRFLLKYCGEMHEGNLAAQNEIVHVIIKCLAGSFKSIVDAKLDGWNGRHQDITRLAQQATATIECLLEHGELISATTSEDLKCFVKFFWCLASAPSDDWSENRIPEDNKCVSVRQLWAVFLSYDYLKDFPSLALVVAGALCEIFLEFQERDQRQTTIPRYLPGLYRGLSNMPIHFRSISSFHKLMQGLLMQTSCSAEMVPHLVFLVNEWCQDIHPVDDVVFKWIASEIPLQDSPADMHTIDLFRSLVRSVFDRRYKACKSPEEISLFLERLMQISTSSIALATTQLGTKTKTQKQSSTLTPVFGMVSLHLLWQYRAEIQQSKFLKEVKHRREEVSNLLVARLENCAKSLQRKFSAQLVVLYATTLQMLEGFDDVVTHLGDGIDKVPTELKEQHEEFFACVKKIEQRGRVAHAASNGALGFNELALLQDMDIHRMQASEQTNLAQQWAAKLESMGDADRIAAIRELQNAGFEDSNGASRLLLAGLAASVINDVGEKDGSEARAMSSFCTAAVGVLQRSIDNIERFSLAAESVDVILRLHPRGVTQFNIDSCLTAITTAMSRIRSSRGKPNQVPIDSISTIYIRFCRLLGTIVGLYRQQLGGRFHILIPALQSLLETIFAMHSPRLPRQEASSNGGALGVGHAVQFTRLLTSLCDPTVSAVTRPSRPPAGLGTSNNNHKSVGLVDQTKKAKVTAAQHLRILIESYAQLTLSGPLQAEIKAALAPGLYAILDAMPADSKRALNAGMDPSSRAIFKTLHEEYVRYGKWNSKG